MTTAEPTGSMMLPPLMVSLPGQYTAAAAADLASLGEAAAPADAPSIFALPPEPDAPAMPATPEERMEAGWNAHPEADYFRLARQRQPSGNREPRTANREQPTGPTPRQTPAAAAPPAPTQTTADLEWEMGLSDNPTPDPYTVPPGRRTVPREPEQAGNQPAAAAQSTAQEPTNVAEFFAVIAQNPDWTSDEEKKGYKTEIPNDARYGPLEVNSSGKASPSMCWIWASTPHCMQTSSPRC